MKKTYYGFCDLENLGRIERIDFSRYRKLYIFVGTHQKITEQEHLLLTLTQTEIIYVSSSGKDALDKVLILYLGKVNHESSPEVIFEVISKDRGFDVVREMLDAWGRPYQRNGSQKQSIDDKTRLFLSLFSIEKEKRPKQYNNLVNFLKTTAICKNSHESLPIEFIMSMVQMNCIMIEKGKAKDPYVIYCDPS
jgi:hypothetical protein